MTQPLSLDATTPAAPMTGRSDAEQLRARLRAALGSGYELGPELGRGGMGVVLRATDLKLRRDVAIKVLPPELAWRSELRQRLLREAQLAASLSHPNIVPIYDVGETDELVWLIMAFVDGETLTAKVEREGPQPLSRTRRVLQNVAWALAYAHARGVIHRDIKPDNIMIESATGRPVVTDFGIAKAISGDARQLTLPGQLIGTLIYMAPEQLLETAPPDGRSDIYSLGLVGYFLLTGQHAFNGPTVAAIIAEHSRGAVPDPTISRPRIPPRVAAALGLALAHDPAARTQTGEAFAEAIGNAGPDIPETPAPIRAFFSSSRRSMQILALLGIVLGIIGFADFPPVLTVLIVGAVVAGWTRQLEITIGAGYGWEAIRRAIYGERARFLDERSVRFRPRTRLPLTTTVWVLTIVGSVVFGTLYLMQNKRSPQSTSVEVINDVLLIVCAYGGVWAAKLLGFTRPIEPGQRRSASLAFRVAAPTCAVAATILGVWIGPLAGGLAGVAASLVTFAWIRLVRPAPTPPAEQWKLPLVVETIGSLLFSPLVWQRGLHLADEPTRTGHVHRGTVSQARRHQQNIERALARLPASEVERYGDLRAELAQVLERVARQSAELSDVQAERVRLEAGAVRVAGQDPDVVLGDRLERAQADEERLAGRLHQDLALLRNLDSALNDSDAARRSAALAAALQQHQERDAG